MPMTEDELRTALHRIPAALPPAPDRLSGIEERVRRRRRRVAGTVAAVVALVLLAVPVVRLVSDQQQRDSLPVTPSERQVRDAMMQYAAFVTYWDGTPFNVALAVDPGVEGVEVSTTLPPFSCTVARSAPGEPAGTQQAWVLGTGSVIPADGAELVLGSVAVTYALWPVGVTTCDPRPVDATALASPPASASALLAEPVIAAQTLDDPSRPALDVAAAYHRIPADRLTQHGREVFAAYEQHMAQVAFGTTEEQDDRVLVALLDWLGAAAGRGLAPEPDLVPGPTLLRPTDTYAGTALLPEGYEARWSTTALCIQGEVGGSGVRHVSQDSYVEPGSTPEVFDGPCPG